MPKIRLTRAGAAAATLALLLACGGRVESSADPERTAPQPPHGPEDHGTGFGETTALAACELGFDPLAEPERDCHWLAKDRCYETKLSACACICPRDSQHSSCLSDFDDGPNSRTLVTCY